MSWFPNGMGASAPVYLEGIAAAMGRRGPGRGKRRKQSDEQFRKSVADRRAKAKRARQARKKQRR